MQTLYPPLSHSASGEDAASDKNGDDSVLSPELRENFDAMRALVRAERRPSDKHGEHDHDEEPRRRKARQEERDVAKRELALKTALLVESEISRLRNGIAELEARLVEQEGDVEADMPFIAFPSLPQVVPDDSQDDRIFEGSRNGDPINRDVVETTSKTDKSSCLYS